MNMFEVFKIVILWIGAIGLIAAAEIGNWPAFGACSLLALSAIIFKDAKIEG